MIQGMQQDSLAEVNEKLDKILDLLKAQVVVQAGEVLNSGLRSYDMAVPPRRKDEFVCGHAEPGQCVYCQGEDR